MPPFNGSGSFSPYVPGNPVIPGTVISSTGYNATQQDIAAGLSNAVTRDGQSPLKANLPAAGRKITGLGAGVVAGDSLRFEQLFSQGAEQDIASAATVDIGGLNTTIARITGTTTITSFGTNYNGPRFVRFASALLLTHNATTLILPGGANITTAAGDRAILTPVGNPGNGWQVLAYEKADGSPISFGVVPIAQGGTGQTTAAAAFAALKQDASTTATGVVELATNAEGVTGTDALRAMTPASTKAARVAAPAFAAFQSTLQALASNTATKLQFQTEEFDNTTAFDSTTNYRFTPQVAGYYQVNGAVQVLVAGAQELLVIIYKNGAAFKIGSHMLSSSTNAASNVSSLVFLNGTTDYIELYANSGIAGNTATGATATYFSAALVVPT